MGNGAVQFTDAKMLDADGNPCHAFPTGAAITVEIAYAAQQEGLEGNFGYGEFSGKIVCTAMEQMLILIVTD